MSYGTEQYQEFVINALDQVADDYMEIPTTGRNITVTRERVFCYELYHQIRYLLDKNNDNSVVRIHGEIDKKGHEHINPANPDFVIHEPGTNDKNHIVIEVKTNLSASKFIDDLLKLQDFISFNQCHYHRGLFILVGHDLSEFKDAYERSKHKSKDKVAYNSSSIYILTKMKNLPVEVNRLDTLFQYELPLIWKSHEVTA